MNSNPLKIVVVIDNPNRDLPSCILLAQSLLEKSSMGSTIHVIQMNSLTDLIFSVHPDYVLLNYARHNNAKLIKQIAACKIKIGILDTEGGVFTLMPKTQKLNYFNAVPNDPVVRQKIQHYFVWGQKIYDAHKVENCYTKDQLHLTGTPRSDFYHSNFDFIYNTTPSEKIILFNTSFSLTNPKFSTCEKEVLMLNQTFGYPIDYLNLQVQQFKIAEQKLIEQARYIAEKFPDIKIIFRPHPFENEKVYENSFNDLKNIQVTGHGAVDQWLRRSICIIHYECSTAIEAACLKIPVFAMSGIQSVRPIPDADLCTDFFDTKEDLCQRIQNVIEKNYILPEKLQDQILQAQKNVYYSVDGNSNHRISEIIIADLNKNTHQFDFTISKFYNLYWNLKNKLKHLLGKNSLLKPLDPNVVKELYEKQVPLFKKTSLYQPENETRYFTIKS
jgi:surface carbohydrate biosynthesis protein